MHRCILLLLTANSITLDALNLDIIDTEAALVLCTREIISSQPLTGESNLKPALSISIYLLFNLVLSKSICLLCTIPFILPLPPQ